MRMQRFISGRTSIGDDPAGRLICEQVIPFDEVPKDLWLKFADKTEYDARWPEVTEILRGSDGHDTVIIYLEKERAKEGSSRKLACGSVNRSDGKADENNW